MQREIKFHGKCSITGAWTYGYYYLSKGNHIIRDKEDRESIVLEKSVGQYIGLKDKNGKKIYKGHIVTVIRKGSNSDRVYTGLVEWKTEQCGFMILSGKYAIEILSLAMYGDENGTLLTGVEIIGNIHDNPELLY